MSDLVVGSPGAGVGLGEIGSPESAEQAAAPVIIYRYGSIIPDAATAYGFPYFESYNYFEAQAHLVIAIRLRRLEELAEAQKLVQPLYYALVPFIEPAAAITPVIPVRQGQLVDQADGREFARPQYYALVPLPGAVANIGYRYGQNVLAESLGVVPSQYQPFPYFEQPANPPIPVRRGQDVPWAPDAFNSLGYQRFPYFQEPPATANPVIPIQLRILAELQSEALWRYPYFESYSYTDIVTPGPASPVIPFIRGQWLGDAVQPLVGIQGYQRFPYPGVQPASANPAIPTLKSSWFGQAVEAFIVPFSQEPERFVNLFQLIPPRYGQSILTGPEAFVTPQYQRFPYFEQPQAARPVILFRQGQWIGDAVVPFFDNLGYQRFPYPGVQPAPSNPILWVVVRRLEELSVEGRMVQPAYFVYPYPSSGAAAPVLRLLAITGCGI